MSRKAKLIRSLRTRARPLPYENIADSVCLYRATKWSFTNPSALLRIQRVGLLCTASDNFIGLHD